MVYKMLAKQIYFKIKSRFFIDKVSNSDIDIHARKKMVIDDRRSENVPYKHNKQIHQSKDNSTTINHHTDYNDNDQQNMNMSLPMNITQGWY